MEITIFTATGCTRCGIVKNFMDEQAVSYIEKNIKAEGKEDFRSFYKTNRSEIYRGPDGIEFPIITDGKNIRQSIGACLAYLHAGENLDGFFVVGSLHGEWVDGIYVSGGNPAYTKEFIEVLKYIKDKNLKVQLKTNGKNPTILKEIVDNNLADMVIMHVLGPQELYSKILGENVDIEDIKASLALTAGFQEYKLITTIAPIMREDGRASYLTPEEIAETAKLIEEGTASNKNTYILRSFDPKEAKCKEFKNLEPLAADLFSYRTKARNHQFFTEIEST